METIRIKRRKGAGDRASLSMLKDRFALYLGEQVLRMAGLSAGQHVDVSFVTGDVVPEIHVTPAMGGALTLSGLNTGKSARIAFAVRGGADIHATKVDVVPRAAGGLVARVPRELWTAVVAALPRDG